MCGADYRILADQGAVAAMGYHAARDRGHTLRRQDGGPFLQAEHGPPRLLMIRMRWLGM